MAYAHASPLAEESLDTILRCLKPGEMSSLPGVYREAGSGGCPLLGRWLYLSEAGGGVCSARPHRRSFICLGEMPCASSWCPLCKEDVL